jgi:hypothetical protein
MSTELLTEFLIHPTPPGICSDLPEGMKIIDCMMHDALTLELWVQHDSFPVMRDGDIPPIIEVTFHSEFNEAINGAGA